MFSSFRAAGFPALSSGTRVRDAPLKRVSARRSRSSQGLPSAVFPDLVVEALPLKEAIRQSALRPLRRRPC